MFQYKSTQKHSIFTNGEGRVKTHDVVIRGKAGYKMVTIRNKHGKVTKRSKRRLSKKEIDCIRRCEFIPQLFKDCEKCLKK